MTTVRLGVRALRMRRRALCGLMAVLAGATPAAAQTRDTLASAQPGTPTAPWDYRGLEMSRGALEQLVGQYDAVVASTVYSERLREDARDAATRIRERLEQGDFRQGDRIVVDIVGENQRSDTVTVDAERQIELKGMGRFLLGGVLRSELQGHLEREIGRFIKTPEVKTASLIRLVLQGAIGRPGFQVFPANALLDDVIQQSGGLVAGAELDKIVIQRDGEVLLNGADVRQALVDGKSIDELNLRAGDEIVIPATTQERPGGGGGSMWGTVVRYAFIIAGPLLIGRKVF